MVTVFYWVVKQPKKIKQVCMCITVSDNFEYKSGSASQSKSTDDSRSCVLVSNLPGDSTQVCVKLNDK